MLAKEVLPIGKALATVTAKTIYVHPDAHPVVLDLITVAKYGVEWFDWEPETLQESVRKDFGGLSSLNFSKLMAMKTLHVTKSFWQSWEIFGWCCMPFNGILPDFDVMQAPTVAQCSLAVDIANRTRDDVEWGQEIETYLSVVHIHDGILVPQPPLEELVSIDVSSFPVDMPRLEIESKWPEVRRTRRAPSGDTHEDEQLRRMLDVYEYLDESRTRLRDQLPLVTSHA